MHRQENRTRAIADGDGLVRRRTDAPRESAPIRPMSNNATGANQPHDRDAQHDDHQRAASEEMGR